MEGATAALKAKLDRLLQEAAEVSVALDRAGGTITGVPHYSLIEARAHELGQQLSREIQARQIRELVRGRTATAPCPKCRARCELDLKNRTVTSIDGPVTMPELEGYCPDCRRAFFPRQRTAGV
jgi:imidazoleglycerol phosphate dehydratase HisB